ncbi:MULTISPECIES: hypothetical protein [unclassified Pseudomonas]|uniref:hypothetical protein n=1 Tax=unclassified Pseudomonas TaxID=196821 RepID=UPI00381F1B2F
MKFSMLALSLAIADICLAADLPDSRPKSRYTEISIHELPMGSEKDLDASVREYSKQLRTEGTRGARTSGSKRNDAAAAALATYPNDHVYEADNALISYKPGSQLPLTNYSSLMIKPIDLKATSACELMATDANGVYSRKRKEYSGFSRYFKCPDGDVYTKDMTFFGMRKVVIKEQNNIVVSGISGRMYGYRDKKGNSYTTLWWVSNDIDHAVQKSGTDASTRNWLVQYAEELIAKEAK